MIEIVSVLTGTPVNNVFVPIGMLTGKLDDFLRILCFQRHEIT
jgi:hypothetical protein